MTSISMRDVWVVVAANDPGSIDDGDPIYLSAVEAAKAMVSLNADEENGRVYIVISLADAVQARISAAVADAGDEG